MPYVAAHLEAIAEAADAVAGFGSAVDEAGVAAAARTTTLVAAAADEVSAAVASLFSAHGLAYQQVSAEVATFQRQFVQTLNDAAGAYTLAETANANALAAAGQTMLSAVNAGGGATVNVSASAAPDTPLGNGIALIMGGSGIPTPYLRYAESAAMLYLQPHGFTGLAKVLTTPELIGHTDTTMAEGSRILTNAIVSQIQAGNVDAANPVVVFGYSQSSAMSTFTMQQLHALGVPSDLVHFMLVGNSANPNGGIMSAFDIPPGTKLNIPAWDLTWGNPTPNNLYPTDVYTLEYDGYADFPRYPINIFSDLNAIVGGITKHLVYLGLEPSQITNAIQLPTSGDTMVNYYMIPSEGLPILDPLRLIPIVGQPMFDLLEPDMRILVNLGYGNIDHGWNQGPANVETSIDWFPTDLDWSAVPPALGNGAVQGVTNFFNDLVNPDTYRITPLVQNPVLAPLVSAAYRGGIISNPHPATLWDMLASYVTTPPESA